MVDTLLLDQVINDSGKKRGYLAEKLGISIQSFRLKVNNVYDFKTSEVAVLCTELEINSLAEKEKIFFKK